MTILALETPTQIDRFRAHALKVALKLEILGMKRHGRSAYSIAKRDFGFKGSRKSVLSQLETMLAELKDGAGN